MSETLDLLFRIQTQGIDALDKAAGSTKAIGLETKYSSATLQQFERALGLLTSSSGSYRSALETIAKSSKSVSAETAAMAKDLLQFDKQLQKTADEAEKSAKRQQAALQQLGKAQEAAIAENKRRDAEANKLDPQASGFLKGFGTSALGVGALGGVGLAAGRAAAQALEATLSELTTGFASSSRETLNFSERLGITAGQARALENEARLAGVSIHTLESSARIVSTALEDSEGAGKKAAAAFARLGIDIHGTFGEVREAGPVTLELIERLSKITSETERTREGSAALGRGYKEIIPLVEQYRELQRASEELGANLQTNVIEQAAKADEKFKALGLEFDALKNSLAQKILPIVIPIIESVTRIINGKPQGLGENAASLGLSAGGAALSQAFLGPQIAAAVNAAKSASGFLGAVDNDFNLNQPNNPGELLAGSKFDKAAGPGFQLDAALKATNRRKNAALEDSLESNDLPGRARKAKAAFESSLSNLHSEGENATDKDRSDVAAAKKRSDDLQEQIKEQKDGNKTAKEQLAELKRISHEADSLSGRGQTPQQNIIAAVKNTLDSPEFKSLTQKQQQQARSELVAGAAEGLAREDKKSDATKAAKEKVAEDKFQREQLSFADKETKDDAGTKGDPHSGPFGNVIAELDALTGKTSKLKGSGLGVAGADIPVQATSQELLKNRQDDEKRQERLLEVNSRPGQELATQKAISDLRLRTAKDALTDELRIASTLTESARVIDAEGKARVQYAQTVKDIHEEDALKQAEANRKSAEDARSIASGLTEAAFGGGKGIRSFVSGEGRKLASQVGGNLGGEFVDKGIHAVTSNLPTDGVIGKALAGTIFDPQKGKGIDVNTQALKDSNDATKANTDATNNLTATMGGTPTAGSTGAKGSPGGTIAGGLSSILPPGTMSAFSGISKLLTGSGSSSASPAATSGVGGEDDEGQSLASIAAGGSSATSKLALSRSSSYTGASGALGGLGHTGDVRGIFTGVSSGPNGAESLTGSERAGAAVGTAGVLLTGAISAINDFKKGGAKGIVSGIGSVAGTAAALDPEPISKAVLGSIALVSGVVSMVLGDPKKQYLDKMNKEAQQDAYQAPTSISKSMGLNGNYSDTDAQGNARSSNLSAMPQIAESYFDWEKHTEVPGSVISPFGGPNTNPANSQTAGAAGDPSQAGSSAPQYNLTINALDSKSIMDNASILTDAMHKAITAGHPVTDELRAQLNPGYAG